MYVCSYCKHPCNKCCFKLISILYIICDLFFNFTNPNPLLLKVIVNDSLTVPVHMVCYIQSPSLVGFHAIIMYIKYTWSIYRAVTLGPVSTLQLWLPHSISHYCCAVVEMYVHIHIYIICVSTAISNNINLSVFSCHCLLK